MKTTVSELCGKGLIACLMVYGQAISVENVKAGVKLSLKHNEGKMDMSKTSGIVNTVEFEPFVGADYDPASSTRFGKRLLVLGWSHYCRHYRAETGCTDACSQYGRYHENGNFFGCHCEKFSSVVVHDYVTATQNYSRTFKNFCNVFLTHPGTIEEHRVLLNSLVNMEYVQGAEDRMHNRHHACLLRDPRNFEMLKKTIRTYRSQVVIVWGRVVWNELLRCLGMGNLSGRSVVAKVDGYDVVMLNCRHPAAYGQYKFEPEMLRRDLLSAGVKIPVEIGK